MSFDQLATLIYQGVKRFFATLDFGSSHKKEFPSANRQLVAELRNKFTQLLGRG